jgi:hypothetical protein
VHAAFAATAAFSIRVQQEIKTVWRVITKTLRIVKERKKVLVRAGECVRKVILSLQARTGCFKTHQIGSSILHPLLFLL